MDAVEICNLALSRIGMANISRMDEASEPARKSKQFYDVTRRNVLRKISWPFATRRVQLALLPQTPPDFLYAYRYPSDAICLRKMFNNTFDRLPEHNYYKIVSDTEGRVLYTDVSNAWIEYTADVTDCNLFDDGFIQALSWKLAAEIALTLTGSSGMANTCLQAYGQYVMEAQVEAHNEQNESLPELDSLLKARYEV